MTRKCGEARANGYSDFASRAIRAGQQMCIRDRVGKIQPDKTEYYDSLGYSLDAIVGVSGVEKAFEDQLRGIDGQLTVIEDSEGNVIDEYVSKEPIAGNDVYLTIDIEYQKIVEDSLDANIAYIRALAEDKAVSYTHLDVYKRQPQRRHGQRSRRGTPSLHENRT